MAKLSQSSDTLAANIPNKTTISPAGKLACSPGSTAQRKRSSF
jgi:hypothetical protein